MFSSDEYVDMILIYGECRKNSRDSCRLYLERYPDRRQPSKNTFIRLEQKLRRDKELPNNKQPGHQKKATSDDNAVAVLAYVEQNPCKSVRVIANESGMSKSSVHRVLKQHKLHPFKLHLVQGLRDTDYERRLNFAFQVMIKLNDDPSFLSKVLWTDEARFHNNGVVNRHNVHYWAAVNPHWVRETNHQQVWSTNVWCGILDGRILGPYFYQGTLTAAVYLQFLQNALIDFLSELPLQNRLQIVFQQDGAPAHNARVICEYLDEEFPQKWIGTNGPMRWPARSPDMTPLDFFLWGHLKSEVYERQPESVEDLQNKISEACRRIPRKVLQTVTRKHTKKNFERCIAQEGKQFEHLY